MFVIITYLVSRNSYLLNSRKITKKPDNSNHLYYRKIGVFGIVFLSCLIGIYSIIASKYPYSSDRGNYVIRFVNYWDSPWTTGLNVLADFLHIFTNEPKVLFFTVSFLCLFITLVAYNTFENAQPKALLFMSLSSYCIDSFFLLKQAPSVAFAAISIAALFNRKFKISTIFLVIAISFHEAALILIPLYIVLLGAKKQWVRIFQYIFLIVSILFFSYVTKVASGFIAQLLPNVSDQLSGYLDESGSIIQSANILTIFKGFPYYFITFYAMLKRSSLKSKIRNYDRYLVICVFATAMIIMSFYMYWMSRFATYCYFPMFIFASLIMREINNRGERFLFLMLVGGSLFFFTFRYLYQMFFLYGGF